MAPIIEVQPNGFDTWKNDSVRLLGNVSTKLSDATKEIYKTNIAKLSSNISESFDVSKQSVNKVLEELEAIQNGIEKGKLDVAKLIAHGAVTSFLKLTKKDLKKLVTQEPNDGFLGPVPPPEKNTTSVIPAWLNYGTQGNDTSKVDSSSVNKTFVDKTKVEETDGKYKENSALWLSQQKGLLINIKWNLDAYGDLPKGKSLDNPTWDELKKDVKDLSHNLKSLDYSSLGKKEQEKVAKLITYTNSLDGQLKRGNLSKEFTGYAKNMEDLQSVINSLLEAAVAQRTLKLPEGLIAGKLLELTITNSETNSPEAGVVFSVYDDKYNEITSFKTDAEGKATIRLNKAGKYSIADYYRSDVGETFTVKPQKRKIETDTDKKTEVSQQNENAELRLKIDKAEKERVEIQNDKMGATWKLNTPPSGLLSMREQEQVSTDRREKYLSSLELEKQKNAELKGLKSQLVQQKTETINLETKLVLRPLSSIDWLTGFADKFSADSGTIYSVADLGAGGGRTWGDGRKNGVGEDALKKMQQAGLMTADEVKKVYGGAWNGLVDGKGAWTEKYNNLADAEKQQVAIFKLFFAYEAVRGEPYLSKLVEKLHGKSAGEIAALMQIGDGKAAVGSALEKTGDLLEMNKGKNGHMGYTYDPVAEIRKILEDAYPQVVLKPAQPYKKGDEHFHLAKAYEKICYLTDNWNTVGDDGKTKLFDTYFQTDAVLKEAKKELSKIEFGQAEMVGLMDDVRSAKGKRYWNNIAQDISKEVPITGKKREEQPLKEEELVTRDALNGQASGSYAYSANLLKQPSVTDALSVLGVGDGEKPNLLEQANDSQHYTVEKFMGIVEDRLSGKIGQRIEAVEGKDYSAQVTQADLQEAKDMLMKHSALHEEDKEYATLETYITQLNLRLENGQAIGLNMNKAFWKAVEAFEAIAGETESMVPSKVVQTGTGGPKNLVELALSDTVVFHALYYSKGNLRSKEELDKLKAFAKDSLLENDKVLEAISQFDKTNEEKPPDKNKTNVEQSELEKKFEQAWKDAQDLIYGKIVNDKPDGSGYGDPTNPNSNYTQLSEKQKRAYNGMIVACNAVYTQIYDSKGEQIAGKSPTAQSMTDFPKSVEGFKSSLKAVKENKQVERIKEEDGGALENLNISTNAAVQVPSTGVKWLDNISSDSKVQSALAAITSQEERQVVIDLIWGSPGDWKETDADGLVDMIDIVSGKPQ